MANEAAIVHNTYHNPAKFPPMIWSTNYNRYVNYTMFSLFFGGRDFAPKAIIDGINIQEYLQSHFINAMAHVAKKIHEARDLEDTCILGWENMNEVTPGMIGHMQLDLLEERQILRLGTVPTPFQSMLLASGMETAVAVYEFGSFGPSKKGSRIIDPEGVNAFLAADYDDSRYGWTRSKEWVMGRCIWALHGGVGRF